MAEFSGTDVFCFIHFYYFYQTQTNVAGGQNTLRDGFPPAGLQWVNQNNLGLEKVALNKVLPVASPAERVPAGSTTINLVVNSALTGVDNDPENPTYYCNFGESFFNQLITQLFPQELSPREYTFRYHNFIALMLWYLDRPELIMPFSAIKEVIEARNQTLGRGEKKLLRNVLLLQMAHWLNGQSATLRQHPNFMRAVRDTYRFNLASGCCGFFKRRWHYHPVETVLTIGSLIIGWGLFFIVNTVDQKEDQTWAVPALTLFLPVWVVGFTKIAQWISKKCHQKRMYAQYQQVANGALPAELEVESYRLTTPHWLTGCCRR